MSKNYDNWERLVGVVLRRESDRQLAYSRSSDSSSISETSKDFSCFNSTTRFDEVESNNYNDVREKLERVVLHREGGKRIAQTISPLLERIEYSDLQTLHHSDWKKLLLPHQQQVVWKSASLIFFPDTSAWNGKNCFLVGSKNIQHFNYKHRESKSYTKSRFSEVLEIYDPEDLDVGCRIKTQMLSPDTLYTAYLVYAPTGKYAGVIPLAAISTLDGQDRTVYFETDNGRSDGWMEVELGNFRVYPREEDREVQIRLTCSIKNIGKGGLIIEGFEFRPSYATSPPIQKGEFLPIYHSYLVRTGKNSLMLGARALLITWEDNSFCWKWTRHDHSRFPEVVELKYVWWLRIRGKINTRMLSPKTDYAAFLVFNLAVGYRGLEQAKGMIKFLEESSENDAEKGARVLNLLVAVSRADGWMEIEMGSFYVDQDNEREVEAQLFEFGCNLKSGLIVEGIEFRAV